MNCDQVHRMLAEDSTCRTEAGVAAHLRACPECRRMCDDLIQLEDLSRSLSGDFRVPASFRDEVLARVAVASARTRRRRRWGFAVAATLLMGTALGLLKPWQRLDAVTPLAAPDEASWTAVMDSVDGEGTGPLIEVVLDGESGHPVILRLPPTIEIRRTDLQEDFYIRHVSH